MAIDLRAIRRSAVICGIDGAARKAYTLRPGQHGPVESSKVYAALMSIMATIAKNLKTLPARSEGLTAPRA